MRTFLVFALGGAALTLCACQREDARPAKEAVAQAKGAAADAKATAQQAAVEAQATVHEAATAARATAQEAKTAAEGAANQAAQGVRELGEGGVVTGQVTTFSSDRLVLRPEKAGPADLRVDGRTRYLLRSGSVRSGGLAAGTRVRATYVVEARVAIATEVEVLPKE